MSASDLITLALVASLRRLARHKPGPTTRLRMIDEDEYYVMVGGSIEDVRSVLDEMPRRHESMSLRADLWRPLMGVLSRLDEPHSRLLNRLSTADQPMAGDLGYIVRYGVIVDVAARLRAFRATDVRLAWASEMRSSLDEQRWSHPAIWRGFDDVRAFIAAAVEARRSLHVLTS